MGQNLHLMLPSKAYKWLNNNTLIHDLANDDAWLDRIAYKGIYLMTKNSVVCYSRR
jgi:hypothetical protein